VQRQSVLLLGLAGAVVLLMLSRTQRGQQSAQGFLEFVDVTASEISNAVRSRGYRNNNPGNIRHIERNAWNGQVGNDGGFGVYSSPQLGTRALGKQLLAYANRGLVTVREIISTWAPSNENNTRAYIASVSGALGVDPDAQLEVARRLPELARAIAKHENGYVASEYDFNSWVYIA
jgi:hypothetical protein